MAKAKVDGGTENQGVEGEFDPALMAAAEDLISAIHGKDATRVASALKAAVELATAEPMPEIGDAE